MVPNNMKLMAKKNDEKNESGLNSHANVQWLPWKISIKSAVATAPST